MDERAHHKQLLRKAKSVDELEREEKILVWEVEQHKLEVKLRKAEANVKELQAAKAKSQARLAKAPAADKADEKEKAAVVRDKLAPELVKESTKVPVAVHA